MKIISSGLAKKDHVQAIIFFQKGNYKDASSIWAKIVEIKSDDTLALKALACCLFIDDKTREALSYLEEASAYAATDPEITNLLALIHLSNGNVQQAIEVILDAQELQTHPLLNKTLNAIKQLKDPTHAKNMPLISLIQLTLPRTTLISNKIFAPLIQFVKRFKMLIFLVILFSFLYLVYPQLRNWATSLNIRNRGEISPATEVSIKGIKDIINARENFRIILDEKVIIRKFEQLKTAISEQHHNKAKMLVNELLASNASLAVKERISILESFIIDPSTDNIDYVPTYAEIAVAPAIYQGVMLRWQGTIANIHHQGRSTTSFDLLVNFLGNGQVEGLAAIETEGFQELNNGDKITVIGPILGISKDNRVIIKGQKIIPY